MNFVLKNATVILIYDAEVGAQGLLAVSPSGAWWLPGAPGSGATTREISLPDLRRYFTSEKGALDGAAAEAALAAIDEKEVPPS